MRENMVGAPPPALVYQTNLLSLRAEHHAVTHIMHQMHWNINLLRRVCNPIPRPHLFTVRKLTSSSAIAERLRCMVGQFWPNVTGR